MIIIAVLVIGGLLAYTVYCIHYALTQGETDIRLHDVTH